MRSKTLDFMNDINKYANVTKPTKNLNESEETIDNDFEVYMNTWGNYNDYGADVEQINGGWMSIEQAKQFLEAHKDEEPFINDINDTIGLPFEVNEYSNPWAALEKIEKVLELDENTRDIVLSIMETDNSFDLDEALNIYESGDYTFFPGVETDYDLGEAYKEMVGGLSGIAHLDNYIDTIKYADMLETDYNNNNDEEIEDDQYFFQMAQEEIENAISSGNTDMLEDFFDAERLGRDLGFEGYYFADKGAICIH